MIEFNAVDFSDSRFEEVMFLLTLSVYKIIGFNLCCCHILLFYANKITSQAFGIKNIKGEASTSIYAD